MTVTARQACRLGSSAACSLQRVVARESSGDGDGDGDGWREWQVVWVIWRFTQLPVNTTLYPSSLSLSSSPLLPAAAAAAVASTSTSTSTGRTLFSSARRSLLRTQPQSLPDQIDPRRHEELHSRCCFRSCDHRVCPSESRHCISCCQAASQRRSHFPLFPRDPG